ncbi:hypothetical protein WM94_19585 [Pseudomonas sp. ABFPK]|nr:hypothetical protein WM94_19585 [Pseudomonas sp. ABFPK]
MCTEGGHYILQTRDNLFFYFGEVPDTNTEVPLQRIENVLGHFLHFTRTPDGTLTDISATGGTRVHLHYDHPLGRLTDIKRVVNDQGTAIFCRSGLVSRWAAKRPHNFNA